RAAAPRPPPRSGSRTARGTAARPPTGPGARAPAAGSARTSRRRPARARRAGRRGTRPTSPGRLHALAPRGPHGRGVPRAGLEIQPVPGPELDVPLVGVEHDGTLQAEQDLVVAVVVSP